MKIIKSVYNIIFNSVKTVAELSVYGMILLLFIDVVGRYVFSKSTLISYDLTGYFLVGITFLGAAYGLRTDGHIRITIFTDKIPERARKRWLFFIDLISLFFIAVLFIKSIELFRFSFKSKASSSTFMGEPLWVPHLIVPVGLGAFLLEELKNMVLALKELIYSVKQSKGIIGREN